MLVHDVPARAIIHVSIYHVYSPKHLIVGLHHYRPIVSTRGRMCKDCSTQWEFQNAEVHSDRPIMSSLSRGTSRDDRYPLKTHVEKMVTLLE